MTKKDQSEPDVRNLESQVSQEALVQNDVETLSEAIGQETDALMRVAEKLEKASQNFAQQQSGLRQMLKMQSNLKEVLSQVILGIEESSAQSRMVPERITGKQPETRALSREEPGSQRGDCGCSCTDTDCCCFEIVLDKVRAIQPQLEPADSGDIPALINELEVRIFASVNGHGILVPSLSTTMGLRVGSVLLGGKPGSWVSVDRVIETVRLKKGTIQNVIVDFQAAEVDEGIERPIGLKDEYGEASGSLMLDCCVSKIYPAMPTDLSFEHGGTGGGAPGMISLAFYARRVCC